MIGRIGLMRIEPCFMASNKPACGELARVKKNVPVQNSNLPVQNGANKSQAADTFTSSENNKKNVSKNGVKNNKA